MPDERKYRNCLWYGGEVTVSLVCRGCTRLCRARDRPAQTESERYGNPRDLAERRHPYGYDHRDYDVYLAMRDRGYEHGEIVGEGFEVRAALAGMSILENEEELRHVAAVPS